jgi:hydrogenase maturation protease
MSGKQLSPKRGNILIIGYGNTLRGDDGVGQRVANSATSWGMPGLTAIAVSELTPELAEPLAAAALAFFVDARCAVEGTTVEIQTLKPRVTGGIMAHAMDPRTLLGLAEALAGRSPPSWLVMVPGADFSFGEGLSAIGERGAEEALERIRALIEVESARSDPALPSKLIRGIPG